MSRVAIFGPTRYPARVAKPNHKELVVTNHIIQKPVAGAVHSHPSILSDPKPIYITRSKSASAAETDTMSDNPGQRHAVLHDFCMCIPYGAVIGTLGLVAVLLKMTKFGALLIAIGIVEMFLSSMSLKRWKARKGGSLITLLSAMFSGILTFFSIELWRLKAYKLMSGPVALLSACMTVFLLYNVVAGGNPPPKKADDKET